MDIHTLITTIGWSTAVLGVTGGILNVMKMRTGFLFYIAANVLIITAGVVEGKLYNIILFSVYTVIATWGYHQWSKKE